MADFGWRMSNRYVLERLGVFPHPASFPGAIRHSLNLNRAQRGWVVGRIAPV